MILTGGDLIMDAFSHDAARTTTLWDLWTKTLKDHCSLPVEHCIGNHDIWGWNKKKSGTTGEEARWGKRWAMDALGLSKPYRTFDKAGWRFVILDSVFPNGDGYVGRLDDEQFAWLEGLLKQTPASTPVLVLSHIPILTITAFTSPKKDVVPRHEGSASEMMSDMPKLVKLFARHRNVRTCLSGHIHQIDRVDFQGVSYFCNGAVCGAWWKGPNGDCDEGYAIVDLYDDGSVERVYKTYGWIARE
jgi:3',5'-cyclic AMP phosphodiesterase CpdA